MTRNLIIGASMCLAVLATAPAQYQGWQHAGSLNILTTPDGAQMREYEV